MDTAGKLRYLSWSAIRIIGADTSCPACKQKKTVLVKRKYLVTALYRCSSCAVMFRVPKSTVEECNDFYQSDYQQGFTTDCPQPDELAKMIDCSFRDTEKDYTKYIEVLRAVPLASGSTILDFGSSWGYGSWQLSQAGYKVYSFELSEPRACYSAEKLDCELCAPENLTEKVDCFFSAHVIEHLTNPRDLWEIARSVLKPGGKVVLFLPNGEPAREATYKNYHKIWGQVHPLLISPLALTQMGEKYGFDVRCHTSPYRPQEITARQSGVQTGDELLAVASL